MQEYTNQRIKDLLEHYYNKFNCEDFIKTDPIQIPHKFRNKEDVEISAFLTSVIAWGQRSIIIRNADKLMHYMGNEPYKFIMNSSDSDLKIFEGFKHRTFNGADCVYFIKSLKNIYRNHSGLQEVFYCKYKEYRRIDEAITYFRKVFFELPHKPDTEKQIGSIEKNSAAKKTNMFLRWMVRKDDMSVDFGLWDNFSPSDLYLPLDVHSARVSRELGLLKRASNDWKSVVEVTEKLKQFDPNDPVKYDFALFGSDL